MANLNKLKKYHFLYKTINLLNQKFYIGIHSTSNLKDGYLGSGTKLRRSIRKYVKENFKLEILEFYDSRELLIKREQELVNEALLKNPMCMNLKPGGSGGFTSDAAKNGRKKTDKFLENKYGPNFRKIVSKTYFNNLTKEDRLILTQKSIDGQKRVGFNYKTFSGKTHTDKTKQKMSEVKKGKGTGKSNSQFGTMWITNGIENKKIKKEEIIPQNWKRGMVIKKY